MDTKTFTCDNCGASLAYDASTSALQCEFCGSPHVIEQKDPAKLPDYIYPAKIDKNKAKTIFDEWTGSGLFVKNDFKQMVTSGKIEGVYIPFWRYAANGQSQWRGENYEEKTKGEETQRITKPASGTHNDHYITYSSASKGLSEQEADALLPVVEDEKVSYSDDYLAGWKAEAPVVLETDGKQKCVAKARQKAEDKCRSKCDRLLDCNTTFTNEALNLCSIPIWIFAYFYNGQTFRAIINGQTGEINGKKPTSPVKVVIALAIIAAVIAGAILAYKYLV